MKSCRICAAELGAPIFEAPAPSITSISTMIGVAACVHVCETCGHVQSPNLPDIEAFYDTEYRISLDTEGHDQLYDTIDGQPVFRAEHQARLVRDICAPGPGSRVLDYGAAKAGTLRRVGEQCPGIIGYVYDVSRDYQQSWQEWIAPERQAVYELPADWAGTFDLVTAHFVLEHVAEPVRVLDDIARMLKPGGKAFILIPDAISNPGDLIVVDHVNHFTESSLVSALSRVGLKLDRLDRKLYRGAYVVVASPAGNEPMAVDRSVLAHDLRAVREIAAFWTHVRDVVEQEATALVEANTAIYGAGFYGTFIAAALEERLKPAYFLDRNPYVQLAPHLGRPVLDPGALPRDIETVFAGLNPRIARDVLERWKSEIARPDLRIIYLDRDAQQPQ